MHTAESDFAVCITRRSQTTSKMSVLLFSNLWRLSALFYRKTSDVKKISWTICDFQYNFHCNIFRHHREIRIVKFRIKTDTWQATYSAVWCTPWSCFKYIFSWLRGMMHTAELDSLGWCKLDSSVFKNSNIWAKSKPNSEILYPVYQGPRWEVKNLVTHFL